MSFSLSFVSSGARAAGAVRLSGDSATLTQPAPREIARAANARLVEDERARRSADRSLSSTSRLKVDPLASSAAPRSTLSVAPRSRN